MRRTALLPLLTVLCVPTVLAAQVEIRARGASITFGGRLQAQLATSSVEDASTDMFIRRARLEVDVSVGDFLSARVMPDFAGGKTALQDAYVRLDFDRAFRVSFGQFKRAFSAFELASSTDLPIIERDGRVPGLDGCSGVGGVCTFSRLTERLELDGRDVGLRAEGSLGDRVSYMATLTNGQGINVGDVNDGKSVSGRLELAATERVSVAAFGGVHDHPDVEVGETDYAPAFGADLEVGTWRSGAHLLAGVAWGKNWREPGTSFLTAQALASYYVAVGTPRLAGVEPLLRVSWGDPDRDGEDDSGLLLTPGLMLYFQGKNGLSANFDVYSPGGERDTEWSFKLQSYVYF
ncbi:MAG TPA: porin [Candidatus Thermoplasmatota archaeon]